MTGIDRIEADAQKATTKTHRRAVDESRGSVRASLDTISMDELDSARSSANTIFNVADLIASARNPKKTAELFKFIGQDHIKDIHDVPGITDELVNDLIYKMRLRGISTVEIATKLKIPSTEVTVRMAQMIQIHQKGYTESEYRHIQIARLESVINMLWNIAEAGSIEHIDVLVKAIERLNKMFSLESDKSIIEVNIVTKAQTELIIKSVNLALNSISELIPATVMQESIDNAIANALDGASQLVESAAAQPLVIDHKGNEV